MSYIESLKVIIDTDPLTRGYGAMANKEIAESLNSLNGETRNRTDIPRGEFIRLLDFSEVEVKTEAERSILNMILSQDVIDLSPGSVRDALISIFAGGSIASNVQAALKQPISDAISFGLKISKVKEGHIEMARAI